MIFVNVITFSWERTFRSLKVDSFQCHVFVLETTEFGSWVMDEFLPNDG